MREILAWSLLDHPLSRMMTVRDYLRRKPEMHHVAVGDLVVLAFQPQLADVARRGLALLLGALLDRARIRVAGRGRRLVDVADVKHRHRGEQAERMKQFFFLRLALDEARGLALAQERERAVDEVERFLRLLVLTA